MRLQVGDIWASSTWPPRDELQKLLTKFAQLVFLNKMFGELTFDKFAIVSVCIKITSFSTSCLFEKK